MYFDKKVDEALAFYKSEEKKEDRDKVFVEVVLPAFKKLSQYHYYKFPVSRNEDTINECIAHLCEAIPQWDKDRVGFSYFNMVAKNFFNQKIKKESKQISNDQYMTSLSDFQAQKGNLDPIFVEEFRDLVEDRQFSELFVEHLYRWQSQFKKDQEKIFMDGFITLFENSGNIICKKKAIYFYLKEITGLNAKQLATNLNKLKKRFIALKKKYERGDF